MISVALDPEAQLVGRIVLRPNQSISWRATQMFLLLLLGVSVAIGTFFLIQGYWMILFFNLLEVSVVTFCFMLLIWRNQQQQVIEFSAEEITFSSGRYQKQVQHNWQRYFTKIMIYPPKHAWYTSKVYLRHRDQSVELGGFLPQLEKQQLISDLRRLVNLADQRQLQP